MMEMEKANEYLKELQTEKEQLEAMLAEKSSENTDNAGQNHALKLLEQGKSFLNTLRV